MARIGLVAGWVAALGMAVVARGQVPFDRSQIVLPGEMADAQQWLDQRLATFGPQGSAVVETTVRSVSQGWGTFHHGWSVNHNPLKLDGKIFETGFGSHADAVIELTIPPKQAQFTALCGIDDTAEARAAAHSAVFTVEADGREVFRSKAALANDPPLKLAIDLHGVKKLTLKATGIGDLSYLPIDWVDVKVTSESGEVQTLGERETFARGVGRLFAFLDDGLPSDQLVSKWKMESSALPDEADRTGQRFTWTDSGTGLQCTLEIKRYLHYPVVEWVQRFKNSGAKPTAILENIRPMELMFPADDKLILHHHVGDYAVAESYRPMVTDLVAGTSLHFAPDGGGRRIGRGRILILSSRSRSAGRLW